MLFWTSTASDTEGADTNHQNASTIAATTAARHKNARLLGTLDVGVIAIHLIGLVSLSHIARFYGMKIKE